MPKCLKVDTCGIAKADHQSNIFFAYVNVITDTLINNNILTKQIVFY